MIELMFTFGVDYVLVRIKGHSLEFGYTVYGAKMATIEGLQLSKAGVLSEFPDLADNDFWREEAIKRFKAKVNSFPNEEQVANYVINDLKKYGYKPLYKQVAGHRKEAIK